MVAQRKPVVNTFYEDDDIPVRSGAEWLKSRGKGLCGTAAPMSDEEATQEAMRSIKEGGKSAGRGRGKGKKDSDLGRIKAVVAEYGKPFYILDGHIWAQDDGRWIVDDGAFNSIWTAKYHRGMKQLEEKLLKQLFEFSIEAVMQVNYNTCSHYYERIGDPLDPKNLAKWIPFILPRHQLLCRHGIYDAHTRSIVDTLEGRVIYGDRCWMSPLDITEEDGEAAKKAEAMLKERMPFDLERERVLELMAIQGLTPHAKVRNIILSYGDGVTGKSTTMKLLGQAASRGHVTDTTLHDLVRNDFAFASIEKAHFNVCDESSLTGPGTVDVLKRLSGGQVQIERKYAHSRPAAVSILFILTANKIPDLPDGSSAMTDRLVPVHFSNVYAGDMDNTTMDNNALAQHPMLRGMWTYLFGCWLTACRKTVEEINKGSAEWQQKVGRNFAANVDPILYAFTELLEHTDNPDDKVKTKDIISALDQSYGKVLDPKDVSQYMRKIFGENGPLTIRFDEGLAKGYKGYKLTT